MRTVPERELREDLGQALQHVQAGERLRIVIDGRPVADLVPVEGARQTWVSRDEVERIRSDAPLDPAFTADLRAVLAPA